MSGAVDIDGRPPGVDAVLGQQRLTVGAVVEHELTIVAGGVGGLDEHMDAAVFVADVEHVGDRGPRQREVALTRGRGAPRSGGPTPRH